MSVSGYKRILEDILVEMNCFIEDLPTFETAVKPSQDKQQNSLWRIIPAERLKSNIS